MTPAPSTTHQARMHLVAEGVVASYIHDISSTSRKPRAIAGLSADAYSTPGNQTPKRLQSSGGVSGCMSSA
jgi:hypothetical protein